MKYEFFKVLVSDMDAGEVNQFIAQHSVSSISKEFVANGDESFWAFCIIYVEQPNSMKPTSKKPQVDYRKILNPDDFDVYVTLRNLRKEVADEEGKPAYAIFYNEQLAKMVQSRVTTLSALSGIEGVGKSRVDKYGKQFLALLTKAFKNETSKDNT